MNYILKALSILVACGVLFPLTSEAIIRGIPAVDGQFPALTRLQTTIHWEKADGSGTDSLTSVCTGTFVGPRHVITAGHCVGPGALLFAEFGIPELDALDLDQLRALRVETTLSLPGLAEGEQRLRATNVRIHPELERLLIDLKQGRAMSELEAMLSKTLFDVAILEVDVPQSLPAFPRLPNLGERLPGFIATIVGYGMVPVFERGQLRNENATASLHHGQTQLSVDQIPGVYGLFQVPWRIYDNGEYALTTTMPYHGDSGGPLFGDNDQSIIHGINASYVASGTREWDFIRGYSFDLSHPLTSAWVRTELGQN